MGEHFFRSILIIIAVFVHSFSFASDEDVVFRADAPLLVTVGEPFPIEFALNASPEDDSFVAPAFEGFNVIAGPRVSNGTSVQIINGDITRKVNYAYTFVLMAEKAGRYTIPSARVKVKGKFYSSKSTPVEAVDESEAQAKAKDQNQTSTNRIGEDDIILRMIPSRTSVFKGDPIRVEIKLYTRVNLAGTDGAKMPAFNGFWAQNLLVDARPSRGRESFDGKVYDTHVVADYLLYPQQEGQLEIEPAQLDVVAQIVMQSRNVDPFFGGGHEFYNVRRKLKTKPLAIEVKSLPAGAPSSFNGAVGEFKMDVLPLDSKVLVSNSASSLNIRISGSGNLTLLHPPKFSLPNSFELYNVRTTESITNERNGGVGYKEFEYPFIARAEGDYTIPAVEFSFFNPQTEIYTVLKSEPFGVSIQSDGKDTSSVSVMSNFSKSDIEMLGNDIRFIKLERGNFVSDARTSFMFSWLYFVILFLIFVLFALAYLLLRRSIRDSHNVALRREKTASKIAIQRFKQAKINMDGGEERAFYEEMQRGLWGYLSDKLNIPVSDLTKEYVREELSKRGVEAEMAQAPCTLITRCEEAQYSRMATAQMSELYGEALSIVSKLETVIKRNR